MIKIITGIRRCGKSFLLFELFHEYLNSIGVDDDHIIEIALDDRANAEYRDPDKILSYINGRITDRESYYVLLDEVQMKDDLTPYRDENGDLFVGLFDFLLDPDILIRG